MADAQNTTARTGLQNAVGGAAHAQPACQVRKFWKVHPVSRAMISEFSDSFVRYLSFAAGAKPGRRWVCAAVLLLAVVAGTTRLGAQAVPAPTPSVSPVPSVAPTVKEDLIGVLKAAGNFKTFLKAVEAADLTATLRKPGPLTIFAPTDSAFSKMPAGALDELLKPENKAKLVKLVSYHIASGKLTAADLLKADEVKTLEGTEIDVEASADGKTIEVDEGKILGSDIAAANGVLHAIDSVLQP